MIDRTKLNALLGDDPKMVQRFVDIFTAQTPEQLLQLKKSVINKEWDMASITAHTIKSQCEYLGLEELTALTFKIEQLTEDKLQLELTLGLVEKLSEQLNEIIRTELD